MVDLMCSDFSYVSFLSSRRMASGFVLVHRRKDRSHERLPLVTEEKSEVCYRVSAAVGVGETIPMSTGEHTGPRRSAVQAAKDGAGRTE